MARFYGRIGFVTQEESPIGSGIYVEVPYERMYRGEVTRNYKRWDNASQLNPNLNISNTISILADPYVNANLSNVRYVKWLDNYWSVTSAEVSDRRLVLSIGGVYNGPTVDSSGEIGEHPRNT